MVEDEALEPTKPFDEITDDPAFFNLAPEGKAKFLEAFTQAFEASGDEAEAIAAGWEALTTEYEARDRGGLFEHDLDED